MRESGELINKGRRLLNRTIKRTLKDENVNEAMIREAVTSELQSFLYEQTERHPMILPMFVTV
jgi:Predicted hydrolase of the metallo-beta-lactamase superfamily